MRWTPVVRSVPPRRPSPTRATADFDVIPQLISKAELSYILSTRVVGQALRARRKRLDILLDAIKHEEEQLSLDVRASRTLPGMLATIASSARAPGGGSGSGGEGGVAQGPPLRLTSGAPLPATATLAAARIPQRLARLEQVCCSCGARGAALLHSSACAPLLPPRLPQLRTAVASHGPGSALGVGLHVLRETTPEARMGHGPYELSYLEFLEVRGPPALDEGE